jgi:hypothetical protein
MLSDHLSIILDASMALMRDLLMEQISSKLFIAFDLPLVLLQPYVDPVIGPTVFV